MHYYRYQDIYYSISKLWDLTASLPAIKINIKQLENLIYVKNWKDNDGNKINIVMVLNNISKYKYHYDKIIKCDLSYPILVQIDNRIIDGYHRLGKAIINNMKTISVKVVEPSLLNKAIDKKESNTAPRYVYYASKSENSHIPHNTFVYVDDKDAIKSLGSSNSIYLYVLKGNITKYFKDGIYKTEYDTSPERLLKILHTNNT